MRGREKANKAGGNGGGGREFDTEDSLSSENYCTMSSSGRRLCSEFDSGRFADTWTSASMRRLSWRALELERKCLGLRSWTT